MPPRDFPARYSTEAPRSGSAAPSGAGAADEAPRLEAEAARRERELLRSVLDATADAVFVKDLEGRYLVVNAAAAAYLGHPAVEAVGRTDADLLPLAAPGFAASDRRVLAEGRAITFEDAAPDPAGGPPRVFLSTKAPWRDPATGAVAGVVGVAHDITERLRAEARLRAALESTTDSVVALSAGWRFTFLNRRASAQIAGGRDLLGRVLWETFPEVGGTAFERALRRCMARRVPTEAEQFYEPFGRHIAARVFPAEDGGISVFFRDVTEARQAAARLSDAECALRRLARRAAAGAMASGIAHELNQPLAAAANFLGGAAELLRAEAAGGVAPPRVEAAGRALERAAGQVVRAGEILRRLRDFIGRGETERREEAAAEVVAEAVDLALAGERGTRLDSVRVEADPDAGGAWMDRVQVQQVVVNLVRNAVEAMRDLPPGRPRDLLVRVRRAAEPAGGVEVAVEDTGPGLPPEVAARLFEPFVSTKPDGMGVGLSICRAIVEAHGGRLEARSAPAGGAAFRFTLAPGRAPSGEGGP